MSKVQCKTTRSISAMPSRLNQEETQLVKCYRPLTSRDRYALRCLAYAYEEMNKLHTARR